MYRCELSPYILQLFLPLSIFASEFTRQSLNVDRLHFLLRKKPPLLKLKAEGGPFVVNARAVDKNVEIMLHEMKLAKGQSRNYDPFGKISILRLEQCLSTYAHLSKPSIE